MKALLPIAILLIVGLPVSAADALTQGIAAYNNHNFGSAVNFLAAATSTSAARDPIAHYYLANTYLRLNRIADAQNEFRISLQLAPNGQTAQYCIQALQNLGATPKDTGVKAAPAIVSTDSSSIHGQDIASKLPKSVRAEPESPRYSEITQWLPFEKANYYWTAKARLERAQLKAQEVERTKRQAESVLHSLIPSHRAFGESEPAFKERSARAAQLKQSLMLPYEEAREAAHRNVENESNLVEACFSAGRATQGY